MRITHVFNDLAYHDVSPLYTNFKLNALNWTLIRLTVKWKSQLHFCEKVKGMTATLLHTP